MPYGEGMINACLGKSGTCDAVLTDLNGDGRDEIVLVYTNHPRGNVWWGASVYQDQGGTWILAGGIDDPGCKGFRDGLIAGRFHVMPPVRPLPDIEVDGNRARVMPTPSVDVRPACK